MRFLRGDDGCGPLLELDQIRRQLKLGQPVDEGPATIAVAQIVGTAGRARDFDGCFRPVHAALRKRIDEIAEANSPTLDEGIEVVRIDRAYFVVDGHKRVALARRANREYLDARVAHLPSPYAFDADVEAEAIERTAREGELRRHSGLAEVVPDVRFALTDVAAYGELLVAVQSYAYDRVLATGRALTPSESARLWYDDKYLPTVRTGQEAAADLLESMTDADIFLALHRQQRAAWGTECGEPECVADMLLADQRRAALAARSSLDRVLRRDAGSRPSTAVVLPLRDSDLRADGSRPPHSNLEKAAGGTTT